MDYLERMMSIRPATDFIAKHFFDEIKKARERRKKINECKHEHGKYIGHKECCMKCGGIGEGMGESWTLEEIAVK